MQMGEAQKQLHSIRTIAFTTGGLQKKCRLFIYVIVDAIVAGVILILFGFVKLRGGLYAFNTIFMLLLSSFVDWNFSFF